MRRWRRRRTGRGARDASAHVAALPGEPTAEARAAGACAPRVARGTAACSSKAQRPSEARARARSRSSDWHWPRPRHIHLVVTRGRTKRYQGDSHPGMGHLACSRFTDSYSNLHADGQLTRSHFQSERLCRCYVGCGSASPTCTPERSQRPGGADAEARLRPRRGRASLGDASSAAAAARSWLAARCCSHEQPSAIAAARHTSSMRASSRWPTYL